MTNSMPFDEFKARHDDLQHEYREEIRGGVLFGADKQKRAIFLERVDQLLSDADKVYTESHDSFQKAQIETIKAGWQLAKATVFNLDTLFKEKFQWEPPLPSTGKGLSQEIDTRAFYIFRQKVIDQLNIVFANAWKLAEEQVGNDPFGNWVHGRVYFAHDLLYYGRSWPGGVTYEVVCGLFVQLGDTWLQDVITLEAYLGWRRKMKGFQSNEEERRADYLEALGAFEARINSANRVETLEIKERMREYLIKQYLNPELKLADKKEDNIKRFKIHDLAESKAWRIYKVTMKSDELANYYDAYRYISRFYENIIPAIENEGDTAIEARKILLDEFMRNLTIASCFEAAVLMYFVPRPPQAEA